MNEKPQLIPNKNDKTSFDKIYLFFEKIIPVSKIGIASAVAASIGTVVTVLGVVVALGAALVSRYQLDTAKQQLAATDRPWIKIQNIDSAYVNIEERTVSSAGFISLKNIGKSPALDVQFLAGLIIGNIVSDEDIDAACKRKEREYYSPPLAIFPEDTVSSAYVEAKFPKLRLTDKFSKSYSSIAEKYARPTSIEPKEMYKYAQSFSMIVCVSYKIYNDERDHSTAVIYEIIRPIPKPKNDDDRIIPKQSDPFDLSKVLLYPPGSVWAIMPSNIVSRAN